MKLNRLDLNKLHAFFMVAQHQGITGAAGSLALTRSAVSQSISALESSLGLRLFDRIGRRLVLTREGQLLRERFGDYQTMLQRTLDEIVNEKGEVRGLIRLGLFLGFPRLRLSAFITRFIARHPKASVRIVYAPQRDLDARLLRNALDYVLSFSAKSEASPKIASTKLFDQELVLVATSRYFRHGFALEELRRVPLIDYYESDPLIHRWLDHHLGERPSNLDVKVWAATTDLVLELVLNHAGAGVVPRYLAEPHVKRRRLRVIGTGRPELTDAIWLHELRGAYRSPASQTFCGALLAEFAPEALPVTPRQGGK